VESPKKIFGSMVPISFFNKAWLARIAGLSAHDHHRKSFVFFLFLYFESMRGSCLEGTEASSPVGGLTIGGTQ